MNTYNRILILTMILLIAINSSAQDGKSSRDVIIGRPKRPPIMTLDGKIYTDSIELVNPNDIGLAFWEYNGNSIIDKYFGNIDSNAVVFIITKLKISSMNFQQFTTSIRQYNKVLFKVDDSHLTSDANVIKNISLSNVESISMVKDFALRKWDTDSIDIFALFVIRTHQNR